jgi:uncharacterized protein (DUF3084 family)
VEILHDAINTLNAEGLKQNNLGLQLDKELERIGKVKKVLIQLINSKDLEEFKNYEQHEYELKRGEILMMEKDIDNVFKEHEYVKEQLLIQKAERVRVDAALKRIGFEIKRAHDGVLKAMREENFHLKLYRRLQATVKNIKMTGPVLKKQQEELQSQLQSSLDDENHLKSVSADLKKEIDIALFDYLKVDKQDKKEADTVKLLQDRNREVEKDIEKLKSKAKELFKEAEHLKSERNLKVSYFPINY